MSSKSISSANPSLGSRGELDSPPSEARGTPAASAVQGGVSSAVNAAAGPPASVAPKTKSGVGTINGGFKSKTLNAKFWNSNGRH